MNYPSIPPPLPPLPNVPEWCSYVARRRPQMKLHAKRGHAVNAVSRPVGHHVPVGGIVYQLVDNEWVVYLTVERPTVCSECGVKNDSLYGSLYGRSTSKKKMKDRTFYVCHICYAEHYSYSSKPRKDWPE